MTEYDYTRKANEKIDVYHLEVALLELGTIRDPGEGAGYEPCSMDMQHLGGGKSTVKALD